MSVPGNPTMTLRSLLNAPKVPRHVHLMVYLNPALTAPGFEALKAAISSMSIDWLKYGSETWILYTPETPEAIYKHILQNVPELKQRGIFTFYFDNSGVKSGQMAKWVWEWLNQKR